ncbi:MAG: hypothetical protein LBB77_00105, partial [Treponema sp.]|nr:hypothetical protein [Treponema sp.]
MTGLVFCLLSSCNNILPPDRGEGTLVITLPGTPALPGRAALSSPVSNGIYYSITCTGPGDRIDREASGGDTVTVSLIPGPWHITVDAVYQGSPAGHGEGDVEVQAGASNTAHITMTPTDEF